LYCPPLIHLILTQWKETIPKIFNPAKNKNSNNNIPKTLPSTTNNSELGVYFKGFEEKDDMKLQRISKKFMEVVRR
jgi:hypothetical protein